MCGGGRASLVDASVSSALAMRNLSTTVDCGGVLSVTAGFRGQHGDAAPGVFVWRVEMRLAKLPGDLPWRCLRRVLEKFPILMN